MSKPKELLEGSIAELVWSKSVIAQRLKDLSVATRTGC